MLRLDDKLKAAREYERREVANIPAGERPGFHLTPPVGWMNDPNGFCFYEGAYHLFFQYHPYSTQWGPMHWGHAVSRDLLHWDYCPCALAPDTAADIEGCFSGSAVCLPDGRLLLLYTGVQPAGNDHKVIQAQCAAVGDGRDFVKSADNPVIGEALLPGGFCPSDFRDPKIWMENGRFYCVASARHREDQGSILLFESPDALRWSFVRVLDSSRDELGRMWECPDFFPLDGTQVLLVSPQEMGVPSQPDLRPGYASLALTGNYDSGTHTFIRQRVQMVDDGMDFYAPQTTLTPDGRRVMIGWMHSWETCGDMPRRHRWFGRMTLPRELTMREGRLCQAPVRELETMWHDAVHLNGLQAKGYLPLKNLGGRSLDLSLTLDLASSPDCRSLTLRFAEDERLCTAVRFDPAHGELVFDRSRCGSRRDIPHVRRIQTSPRGGKLTLRLILDDDCAELFVNEGEHVITALLDTPPEADGLSLFADGPATVDVARHTLA